MKEKSKINTRITFSKFIRVHILRFPLYLLRFEDTRITNLGDLRSKYFCCFTQIGVERYVGYTVALRSLIRRTRSANTKMTLSRYTFSLRRQAACSPRRTRRNHGLDRRIATATAIRPPEEQ